MTDVLELEMRRRLLALVRQYPGLHVRELARQAETSVALVEYHLAILQQAGLVRQQRDERYVRLYAAGAEAPRHAKATQRAIAMLREAWPLRITLHLLDAGQARAHKDICAALDIGKSKLSFHLRKLEGAGIVHKTRDGAFEVRNAAEVQRLLLEYRPTPDLREAFADVWLSLYGKA